MPTTGTVVIGNLKAAGVTAEEAALVTSKVATYLAGASAYHVISQAELSAMAEYHTQMGSLGCDSDACMAQLAKVANASLAISGSVGKVGQELLVSVSLIDVEASTSVAAGSVTLANLEGLDEALPRLCAQVIHAGGDAATPQYRLPAGQKVSFAVFDLKAQGLSEDAARNLTQLLAVELKKVEGTTVVSRDDINAMLQMQQQKDTLGCDSVACLAEIGGALGVDNLIVGDVGKVAERFVVTLRLLDVRKSRALARVNETFEGQEDQLLGAVRQAGRRLIGVDRDEAGGLAIATSQPQASVFLDGDLVGDSPLPPIKTLRAGKHAIRVSKDGFIDWRSDVFVEAGNTTAVWSALDEAPQRWYQKWWVWSVVGGVVAAGVGAGLYFTQAPPATGSGTVFLP
ncbi:MAG TPA: PEGA domain-containing protein [Myxococcota bacterium]|nr:PEGA domain-containing protein [Myxococcota bacterium]